MCKFRIKINITKKGKAKVGKLTAKKDIRDMFNKDTLEY